MAHSNTPKKSIHGSSPTIDGYAIVEKVGSGSYSTVYKGFKTVRPNLDNYIALLWGLKVLLS